MTQRRHREATPAQRYRPRTSSTHQPQGTASGLLSDLPDPDDGASERRGAHAFRCPEAVALIARREREHAKELKANDAAMATQVVIAPKSKLEPAPHGSVMPR